MLYSGKNPIISDSRKPSGQFISIGDERFYEIRHYDAMQPFFISLASDTDLWMYLSSTGGLTAGRRSPEQALFPYYTDDKITEQYEQTGPKTIIRVKSQKALSVEDGMPVFLWEPFSERQAGVYDIERRIAKSTVGNKIVFCEENRTLGLRFSYMWMPAEKHGWVRRATLENLGKDNVEVEMVDGLQNVLPAGVERKTQNEFSTLVDGYKKTELVGTLALFRMEAILVDRAEPSESLRCNTVYTLGLPEADYFLSSAPLDDFRTNPLHLCYPCADYGESKGVRGAVFAHACFELEPSASRTWYNVADVEKDAVAVHDLMHFVAREDAAEVIEQAVRQSTETLCRIVAQNDGVQHTADEHNDARHFANTLFNTMRGGFYLDNYNIGGAAFRKHIELFNKGVAERNKAFLDSLPETINYTDLQMRVAEQSDPQLMRLFREYLPITFGRRHGDPSRPWNLFNIRVQDEQGRPIVSYQGNWRDIFQNWEALSVSYPGYINGIISKFLNATTADGYNPYKVTSEGIDWEMIEPENPWSNIGYWGDHQIIYLLKLLELSYKHDPEALRALLNERQFAFANVPYKFKSYKEIVADPKNTIRFDDDLHKRIFNLIPSYGQDARLVLDDKGGVLLTTMADKLLITLLAKLSNFIPEAGIWMNTLRPEWNDANNALVGYGASMVTLCYMRRYVAFIQQLIEGADETLTIAEETNTLLEALKMNFHFVIKEQPGISFNDYTRRVFVDASGQAGENYRNAVYGGLSGRMVKVHKQDMLSFLKIAQDFIDDSIRKNRRDDGLYHAYNLIKFESKAEPASMCDPNGALSEQSERSLGLCPDFEQSGRLTVSHLYEMLEGQVAVLTSGVLSAEEAADLLDAMRSSALYREDQRSYMLYPARRRKTFLELNNLPEDAKKLPVVRKYLGTVLRQDCDGGIHFDASYRNANNLPDEIKDLYEQVFNHQAFTGRSGTFYKYEGLGCIYWHMVSKLLLAVGEVIADETNADSLSESEQIRLLTFDFERSGLSSISRLRAHYNAIREGIGSHKQPQEYGSFPFDPYSHTPSMAGVQQPGMTGQVKEDILNRFFELGVMVYDGQIAFAPQMLTDADFTDGELRFTYCDVPVVYHKGTEKGVCVETIDGKHMAFCPLPLTSDLSRHIFARDGYVKQIIVTI